MNLIKLFEYLSYRFCICSKSYTFYLVNFAYCSQDIQVSDFLRVDAFFDHGTQKDSENSVGLVVVVFVKGENQESVVVKGPTHKRLNVGSKPVVRLIINHKQKRNNEERKPVEWSRRACRSRGRGRRRPRWAGRAGRAGTPPFSAAALP